MNTANNISILKKKNKFSLINILLILALFLISSITGYLATNSPIVLLIITGTLFSAWLAYFYPAATLIVLVAFGQIIQFELSSVIQSFSGLVLGDLNLRFSDPILLGIIITLLIKGLKGDTAVKKIIAGKGKFLTVF